MMSKPIFLISVFVSLNIFLGRLFQNTIGSLCFIELIIFAVSSFCFWNLSANSIKRWNVKWYIFQDFKMVIIHAGLGFTISLVNILIGQGLIFVYGFFMYDNYESFNYHYINASHTNHIAVNLLCYFSLVFYFSKASKNVNNFYAENIQVSNQNKIVVNKAGTKFLISLDDLIYVESSNNCIVLHTEKGKFVKYQSLKSFQNEIPETKFARIHRSFLINTAYIESISKNKNGDGAILLSSGDELKFSRNYQHLIPQ